MVTTSGHEGIAKEWKLNNLDNWSLRFWENNAKNSLLKIENWIFLINAYDEKIESQMVKFYGSLSEKKQASICGYRSIKAAIRRKKLYP